MKKRRTTSGLHTGGSLASKKTVAFAGPVGIEYYPMAVKPKRKMIDILAVARAGGVAYVRNHTPEQRSKQARKAARARWKRVREQKLAAAKAV